MARIAFENKESTRSSDLPAKNQVKDVDLNEIKTSVNDLYDEVEAIVGDAPENLNTLEEIANSISNDPDFSSTVAQALEAKENLLPSILSNALKYLQVDAGETGLQWSTVSASNLGNSDLTSSANARVFNLNGSTSASKLVFKNSSGTPILNINGSRSVWANGTNNIQSNTIFGEEAGRTFGVGSDSNSAFGYKSLTTLGNAGQNSAFGFQSGRLISVGARNSLFGSYSGDGLVGGNNNAFFGDNAGRVANYSEGSTHLGCGAGYNQGTADYNTFVGHFAGYGVTTGGYNILLGSRTATSSGITTGTGNIVIGNDVAVGNVSNTAVFGSTGITKTILRGIINMVGTPTSSVGLSAGDIWSNLGILTIV